MHHILTRLTLALAASVIVLPAFAAGNAPSLPSTAMRIQPFIAPAIPPGAAIPATGLTPKAMGDAAVPGTPSVNPLRAYPPSCAAYPLPDKASGASWSGSVSLLATTMSGQLYAEPATVTVWRLACSSSGSQPRYNPDGGHAAMTLMRIDRTTEAEADDTRYAYFPQMQAAQGAITDFTTDPKTLVRAAIEPNTRASDFPLGAPLHKSATFVLENYSDSDSGYFTFNDAFTLRVNPGAYGLTPLDLAIPKYEPTPDTYPAAFAPRPLDGYAAAQWINGDDGLLVQVSEQNSGGTMTRQLVFDLLTKDLDGNPWWLVGNAAFPVGTTSLDVEAVYLGPDLSHEPWGKVTIQMPSCGKLDVTFSPDEDLPESVPSFSGLTSYGRLFDANGMVCE